MKKTGSLVLSLTLISGICAAVLAYVNAVTKDAIAAMRERKTVESAKAVMPSGAVAVDAAEFADGEVYYVGKDDAGKVVGYAVAGKDAGGYGGDIVLMVGLKSDKRTVVCYQTLEAAETPGLGMKLTTHEFAGQFAGKSAANLRVKKDGGEIDAITAATITSRAVCRAIENAAKKLN